MDILPTQFPDRYAIVTNMKTARKYHRCICSARALVAFALALAAAMPGCGGGGGSAPAVTPIADPTPPTPVIGPAWLGFGGDAQHSAIGGVATDHPNCLAHAG